LVGRVKGASFRVRASATLDPFDQVIPALLARLWHAVGQPCCAAVTPAARGEQLRWQAFQMP
jgi:hypothetical protein